MWDTIKQNIRDEQGATAVEYGIMVALIAVMIITAVIALGTNLGDTFQEAANCVEQPTAEGCGAEGEG